MIDIFHLVFYGFFLTAVIGLAASWVDRKVTARLQYRVGPPLLQPFLDIVKLLGKETLVPVNALKFVFLAAPLVGLASVILVSTLLWVNNISPDQTFLGDLIVVLYLLAMPSIALMIGGFAAGNPLASVGASREMKMILSYELPFLLAVFVPVAKSGFSIKLGELVMYQAAHGAFAASYSGALALMVAILCVQAKLGLVPFDIAEAESEIVSGPLVDYSGTPLAVFRLMKNMLIFTLPFFLAILFLGGLRSDGMELLYSVLKYAGLVVAITVIRNTNPRVRIDQAMRFFWGPMTILSVIAMALALRGM